MRLKARLARLRTDVDWLKTWGAIRAVERQMELFEKREALEAAKAALAAREAQAAAAAAARRAAPAPKPASVVVPVSVPVSVREVEARPPPREPPCAPDPPAPLSGQPLSEVPPDMQIRPVQWRRRTAQDYADDDGHDYSKCLTDYDVTRAYGEDYDDDA